MSILKQPLTFFGVSSNGDNVVLDENISSEQNPSTDSITLSASFNSLASNKHFTVRYAHTIFAYKVSIYQTILSSLSTEKQP